MRVSIFHVLPGKWFKNYTKCLKIIRGKDFLV